MVAAGCEINGYITGSATRGDINGASATITIPEQTQGTLLVRFSGTSNCDTSFGAACDIYVLLNGVPQPPVAGYVFDSSYGNNSPNPSKSLAMERALGPLDAGTYTIQIQGSFSHGGDGEGGNWFELSNWTLSVERVTTSG